MAYYWYQSDPQLYQMEVAAMKKFFPSFTINQLQDGSGRAVLEREGSAHR